MNHAKKDTKRTLNLGEGSIGKLMLRLALPAIMAQVINVLYNLVDRIYIGNIPGVGSAALTGVGVTFPVIMIISAFSAFVGFGGAPLASIKLGEGDREGAESILGTGVVMLLVLSALLMAFFFAFMRPLLIAFAASEQTIGYAQDYLTIYLYGTLFVQLALGLNPFISAQGYAATAMLSVMIGAVLNIVLDPLLIFGLGMGVKGAALATVISQAASCLWVTMFLASAKSQIRIRPTKLRPDLRRVAAIASLGVSPFIMQSTESLVQITLNRGMLQYGGDLYVGTMTIIISVCQLFSTPVSGYTNGMQPLMSFNYGACKMDRVRRTFKLLLVSTLCITHAATLLTICFPRAFIRMFTSDPQLIELTVRGMRIYMLGIGIFGIQNACQAAFLSLGQARVSLFLAVLRKIILLIPLAMVLPRFMGVTGVYTAEPIADTLSAITAGALFYINFPRILNRRMEQKNM